MRSSEWNRHIELSFIVYWWMVIFYRISLRLIHCFGIVRFVCFLLFVCKIFTRYIEMLLLRMAKQTSKMAIRVSKNSRIQSIWPQLESIKCHVCECVCVSMCLTIEYTAYLVDNLPVSAVHCFASNAHAHIDAIDSDKFER